MKRILAAVFVSVFVVIPCSAQEKTILKNEDIVRMTKSRLGEDVILSVVKQTQTAFRTTPKDLADLRKAKVSDAVIQAMISAVPVPLEPPKPAVDPGRIIKEGVGWPRLAGPSFTEPDPGVAKTGHRLSTGQPRRSDGAPLQ